MPAFTDRIAPSVSSFLPLNLHTTAKVAGCVLPLLAILTSQLLQKLLHQQK